MFPLCQFLQIYCSGLKTSKVLGVPLEQTLSVTVVKFEVLEILKPLSSSVIVMFVPAVGLVHSILRINELKNSLARRDAPLISVNSLSLIFCPN